MSSNAKKMKELQKAAKVEEKSSDDNAGIDSLYRYDLRDDFDGIDGKGDEFKKQADKKLSKLFKSSSTYTNAIELYEKAAQSYQYNGNWSSAADCFVFAADLTEKHQKDNVRATNFYVVAARCMKETGDMDKAVELCEVALKLCESDGRTDRAAVICRDVGEMFLADKNSKLALEYLEKAVNYYEASDRPASAVQADEQCAKLYCTDGDYRKAAELFEKCGRVSQSESINKGSIHQYYYKAMLCTFAAVAPSFELSDVHRQYESYVAENRRNESSREFELIKKLMATFEAEDMKKFMRVLKDHAAVMPFDELETRCALRIKDALKNGPTEALDGDGQDAEDDNYT